MTVGVSLEDCKRALGGGECDAATRACLASLETTSNVWRMGGHTMRKLAQGLGMPDGQLCIGILRAYLGGPARPDTHRLTSVLEYLRELAESYMTTARDVPEGGISQIVRHVRYIFATTWQSRRKWSLAYASDAMVVLVEFVEQYNNKMATDCD